MSARRDGEESSLRSRWLGGQMRELREERGLTVRYVAEQLGVDFADVAAHERGRRVFQSDKVVALLELYRLYEQVERDRLLGLARDAFRLPRWEDDFHAPDLDVSMLDRLWLESIAERIRCYSATLVPDLLRTSSYAEAIVRRQSSAEVSDTRVVWWLRAHRDRQEALGRKPVTGLQAVVAESALRRPVGHPDTLRAQLEHLARAADDEHVQVQVLPADASYVPGMDGSFTVFELPAPYPRLAACTDRANRVSVHEGRAAGEYAQIFDRLRAAALDPNESVLLIDRLAKDMSTDLMV